jgi:hypothetical protein
VLGSARTRWLVEGGGPGVGVLHGGVVSAAAVVDAVVALVPGRAAAAALAEPVGLVGVGGVGSEGAEVFPFVVGGGFGGGVGIVAVAGGVVGVDLEGVGGEVIEAGGGEGGGGGRGGGEGIEIGAVGRIADVVAAGFGAVGHFPGELDFAARGGNGFEVGGGVGCAGVDGDREVGLGVPGPTGIGLGGGGGDGVVAESGVLVGGGGGVARDGRGVAVAPVDGPVVEGVCAGVVVIERERVIHVALCEVVAAQPEVRGDVGYVDEEGDLAVGGAAKRLTV